MSNNTNDVELISAIKPEQDEVASFQRSNRSEAPRQSSFNGLLVFSLVLMAIMMAVGGFQMVELQKKLEQSNELLEISQSNINNLQNELAVTTGKSTSAFKSMAQQQQTNVLEIDKLWKIAHRENRPAITKLQRQFELSDTQTKEFDRRIGSFKANLVKVTTDFGELSTDMVDVRQSIAADSASLKATVASVRGLTQETTDVSEANRRQLASMNLAVSELQEAISVFDRYRQQMNQRLLNLQDQITPVESAPAIGP
ncbi:MAG: hypothetical protein KUG79_05695 [Pseudomonadales bacterium]|nr:hypothetical protein [Pseudomonadales bacterium]